MFLSVGHEKNVIYSKLVNNPFKEAKHELKINVASLFKGDIPLTPN